MRIQRPPASGRRSIGVRNQRDYSAVSWADYFDEAHDVELNPTTEPNQPGGETDRDTFRVYMSNFREPYAPRRDFGKRLDCDKLEISQKELSEYQNVPTLVTLHGGGYSGLTWAQFNHHIQQYCHCRLMAIDLRAHGDTRTCQEDKLDIDTLVHDVIQVTDAVHKRIAGFPDNPKLVLVGHSMGGAIAIKCTSRCAELLPSLVGFVVIDVVEGTAKDALPQMMSVIKLRPTSFPSLENAIEWCVRSGMGKNAEAARVSMPGNLIDLSNGLLAIHNVKTDREVANLRQHRHPVGVDQLIESSRSGQLLQQRIPLPPRIAALGGASCSVLQPTAEESSGNVRHADGEQEAKYKVPPDLSRVSGFGWRTNLAKTQPFWSGWFEGLSAEMLAAPVQGKFLLLAGIDRLDKTLTIGQMQGKFMMKVLPKCGHAVHEDVPEQVAQTISDFLIRNKFAIAKQ